MYFCCFCDAELTTRVVVEARISIVEANDCDDPECRAQAAARGILPQARRDEIKAEILAMIRHDRET